MIAQTHRPITGSTGPVFRPAAVLRKCLALFLALLLAQPNRSFAADKTAIATSALEFGGSLGKLLWVSVEDRSTVTDVEANRYVQLASMLKQQIDEARASSSLLKANFGVVGSALAYTAVADPEPLTKTVSGIAAWGAKKTGDALGEMVIEQSQAQARGILAEGLKNSGLSDTELKNMNADQLRSKVADLKVGGQTLRETLKDDPGSLAILEANASDIATNIGVEALARSQGTAADVKTIQTDLANTKKAIADFQQEVKTHLDNVDTRLSGLEDATTVANQKLDALKTQVQGQSKALQTVAQISYSGWSTTQKLQAVESGLFPDLSPSQKAALVESLKADNARENAVNDLQTAAQDFGNLAAIAGHIGLPKDLVTGLQGAQEVATGIAKFASGDVLGGISCLTSLIGLGGPDAETLHYQAMMKYLEQQFAQVNQKLDKIIDLQVQTLKAIATLADEQKQFRIEVLSQLDRIETTVLRTDKLVQTVLLNQWDKCHSLVSVLNGQFTIPTQSVLTGIIGNPNIGDYAGNCYSIMVGFLDAKVKPAKWSGQIIDADAFPTNSIVGDPVLLTSWSTFQSERINAYSSARDFLLQDLPDAGQFPALYLTRILQPVQDVHLADQLGAGIAKTEVHDQLASFKCDQLEILSSPVRDLLCFGIVAGASAPPRTDRWQDLLGASLIGPYVTGVVDTGIALSTIADFARKNDNGTFVFVKPEILARFAQNGITPQLQIAIAQNKGVLLLEKLRWLTESYVLQQSITYGDYTARLIENALYDPSTRSLNTDPKVMNSLKQKALSAMRANPLLARNVVLLAMRHAVADSQGSPEKAENLQYSATYYSMALRDFTGPQACDESAPPREKLARLLPNWQFEYWVTTEDKQKSDSLKNCPNEFIPDPNGPPPHLSARGNGVGISISDFYVLAPSAVSLASGTFEQSKSLQLALEYRDHLNQALVDRKVADTVKSLSGNGVDAKAIAGRTAFELLNEGWDWQTRQKSHK